ncbi:uncharacterized protein [Salvelinus alpinus]|uniref:uncharacterized protein isoform X2 n=1 Tax=Salvelinus alpinus TaxID=8036 RepID=UPI0039FCC009
MAGQGFQGAPKVMLLLCILGLTKEFELEDKDWDELRSDVAALHRLKGLPDQMTRRTTGADTREIIMHGTRTKRFSNYRAYVEKKPMALFDGLRGCDNFTTCVIQMDQITNASGQDDPDPRPWVSTPPCATGSWTS